MSPRRRFQPTRRRPKIRPSTDAVQATRSQAELAADARHEGLTVTHRFDPGSEGVPFAATVRFTGRREGIAGKPQPGDTFTVDERIERVVPGSGPVSVTTRAYGLNPGDWTVTAQLEPIARDRTGEGLRRPEAARRSPAPGGRGCAGGFATTRSRRSTRAGARSCA